MDFEWDDEKQLSNVRKHGIDFLDAKEIWLGDVLEIPSARSHPGEERFLATGSNRRIISARIARKDERENYHKKVG